MFHVRTKVIYQGKWYRVNGVHEHGKFYDLQHDDGHCFEFIALDELKAGLQQMARYSVADAVVYRSKRYTVKERKWSRMSQTIQYRLQPDDPGWLWAQEYQMQPWTDQAASSMGGTSG